MGRPTKLTPEVQDEICERIARGESLIKILDSHDKFPAYCNITKALRENDAFRVKYVRAKEDQADYLAEEILEISDDGSRDFKTDKDGNEFPDHEHIQRSRLRVDTRKWIASKLKPKKYGEKLELAGDPNAPIKTENKVKFESMSVEELQRFLAAGVGPASADQG